MTAESVLAAVMILLVLAEGGAIILLYFLQARDRERINICSRAVVTLADEWKARTGTEISVDRGLLIEKADVVAADLRPDDEDYSKIPEQIGPWGLRG